MNLRRIIQESINNVIYQNIISETIDEVINERQRYGRRGRNATNRRPKPTNNLQSVRNQNARQRQAQNTQQTNQTSSTGQQSQNTQNTQQQQPQNTQQATPNTQQQQQNSQQQQPQNTQQIQKPDYIQYAQQIQQLIGKTGIDPSPVKSNDAAVNHVEDLNNFLFNVLDAIYDGNVTPQDTTNLAKNGIGGYRRDLSDVGMDASSGIVNYLGNNAERAMQATPGLNQIMGGVFGAGVNAYNKSHNQFARAMDNRGNSNGYSRPGGVHSITPLSQLFAPSGEFNRLYTNYQQINTANGNILNTIPAIPQVYDILNNLRQAITNGNNQQNGQQPGNTQPNNTGGTSQPGNAQNGQQPGNTQNNTGGTPQPGSAQPGTPQPGNTQNGQQPQNNQQQSQNLTRYHWFVDGIKNLDPNGEKLNEIIDKIEENGINSKVEKHLIEIIKWIGEKSDNVVQSIDTNSKLKLIKFMNGFEKDWEGYNKARQDQEYRVLNNKIIYKTMELLNTLHNDMKQHGYF